MVWELARAYTTQGNRVSVVSPSHGKLDYLRERHEIQQVGPADEHVIPLRLDPRVWPAAPAELAVCTRTFLLRRDGIDLYFLQNDYLDLLPDSLYPTNEMEGNDLAFLKPLVFQVDAIRFLDQWFGDDSAVVQCYEPAYTYLIPPVMSRRLGKTTVSTIVVNTRIDDTAHRPQLQTLLQMFDAETSLEPYVEVELQDPLSIAMREYLRPSYLKREPGGNDVNYFALIADSSDLIDFVSPGQRDYYSTFRNAPFEKRFSRLGVSRVVQETAAKQFVGGCAMPDWWLDRDASAVDRTSVLAGLGLMPDLPTFYHAARLDPNHKGQAELFRAIDEVLSEGHQANFIIRCAVASAGGEPAIGNPEYQQIADRHPGNVHLDWRMVDEEHLYDHAAVSDYCLFPSKFELDGFLITMAEAMACGAVPIATAQETLSHYEHTRPVADPRATGFSVPRSFRTDDRTMAGLLHDRIVEAVNLYREEPATFRRLARTSTGLARAFTWRRSAAIRTEHFALALRGDTPTYPYDRAIDYGWFDRIPDDVWKDRRERIAHLALSRGDVSPYRRAAPLDGTAAYQLFDAAYGRADFDNCAQLLHLVDLDRVIMLEERWAVTGDSGVLRIHYRHTHVVRAELVVPAHLSSGVGSGNRNTIPMTRNQTDFSAVLPAGMDGRDPVVLLLLDSGRVAWDQRDASRGPRPGSSR